MLVAGSPNAAEGELLDPDVLVHRVPLVRPVDPLQDVRAFTAVHHVARCFGPHLVHTHMAKAGLVGRLVAMTLRPRPVMVHTFHGHVLDGYFSKPVTRAILGAERFLARRTDRLVAVSGEIRDQLLDLGIGRPDQWVVVPLGLELDVHRSVSAPSGVLRHHLGLAPDVPLVGIVGRLVPIKDHLTLFRSLIRLPDVHLAVLGDGELRSSLEAASARLGVADRTHFVGWWLDVPAAMADLDVVALCSRNEGTPVALIEAGACARPVVATDVGGVRSVVRDGVSGILVRPGDPESLAAAIDRLLRNPALRRSMGAAGRTATEGFTLDRLVEDIRALYEQVLECAR